MMRIPASRDELLDVFKGVASDFANDRKGIERREAELKEMLGRLEAARRKSPWSKKEDMPDPALDDFFRRCRQGLDDLLKGWIASIENHDRNTSLRKDFDDSLLIYVYGKVKAGKSSLGNYLAYGHSRPEASVIDNANPRPEFFLRESTGVTEKITAEGMREQRCFGVDVVEATSSIQGFRLPGMTWIDSPGIHSVNTENGKLASDYVASADLVVFLSNSSSPGRSSDQDELRELLGKRKRLMVLITGSDEIEDDENELGEIVSVRRMKSEKDRSDQIAYFSEEVQKFGFPQSRIHSVSVCYAEEGDAVERERRWQESGLRDFATEISHIAHSEGLVLKRQTPLKNLLIFCNNLTDAIGKFEKEIGVVNADLEEGRKKLKIKTDGLMTSMRRDLPGKIDSLADKYAMDNAGFSAACQRLFDDIFNSLAGDLCKSIGQKFDEISHQQRDLGVLIQPDMAFSKETRKMKHESRVMEMAAGGGGAALGTWGGAEAGAALGTFLFPGIGTAIGGVLGGILGGWLGGGLAGKAGKAFNSTEELDIEVGDNREDVALRTREQFLQAADQRLSILYECLDKLCYVEIADWLQSFTCGLRDMNRLTLKHIHEIEMELKHGVA